MLFEGMWRDFRKATLAHAKVGVYYVFDFRTVAENDYADFDAFLLNSMESRDKNMISNKIEEPRMLSVFYSSAHNQVRIELSQNISELYTAAEIAEASVYFTDDTLPMADRLINGTATLCARFFENTDYERTVLIEDILDVYRGLNAKYEKTPNIYIYIGILVATVALFSFALVFARKKATLSRGSDERSAGNDKV